MGASRNITSSYIKLQAGYKLVLLHFPSTVFVAGC